MTTEFEKNETIVKKKKSSVGDIAVPEEQPGVEEKFTASDFAKIKNLGRYYEEQFRIIFKNEERTIKEWVKHFKETKLINPTIL